MKEQFKHILLTGGTHGNELTGVYLVKKWLQHPELLQRDAMTVTATHTNLEAIKKVQRYVDQDLNRSFNFSKNKPHTSLNCEQQRALELANTFGVHSSQHMDVIIDLHTTASKNGVSLFPMNLNAISCAILKALQDSMDFPINIIVCHMPNMDSASFLGSIARYGFGIEVGPVPMATLDANTFFTTERLVGCLLDLLESVNRGELLPYHEEILLYEITGVIHFPKNEAGDIQALVHPDLLDKNFELLTKGMPLFKDFDGNTLHYTGEDCYPIFINEGAYYDQGIALCMTQKVMRKY